MGNSRESTFRFKRFALSNTLSAMKVGTDGVLLGAWARVPDGAGAPTALDVGCGTGVIGLMLAQRYPSLTVRCIDIDADAVRECAANIEASPFDNVTVEQHDFLCYNSAGGVGLIVSNPPYFKNSLLAPGESRALARHDDMLPLSALMMHAARLLSPAGRLALVLPADRDDDAMFESSVAGLHLCRRCKVYTKEGKQSRRTLWEFGKGCDQPCEESELFILRADGSYSPEYVALLKDFYLAF